MPRPLKTLLWICGVWLAMRAWAALRPTAFPYFARPILHLPHLFVTRARLLEILDPASGERMLEIGPGTGHYTLAVAGRLGPDGRLEILDVRRQFLDHTMDRARAEGVSNIVPTLGDGADLPYPDGGFDAAYLVTVLGEIPDADAALRELRRVLRPGGRLVVGEMLVDPDFTRLGWLIEHADAAGLVFERRTGPPFGYFARFAPAEDHAPDR